MLLRQYPKQNQSLLPTCSNAPFNRPRACVHRNSPRGVDLSKVEGCRNVLEFDINMVAPYNGYPVSATVERGSPRVYPRSQGPTTLYAVDDLISSRAPRHVVSISNASYRNSYCSVCSLAWFYLSCTVYTSRLLRCNTLCFSRTVQHTLVRCRLEFPHAQARVFSNVTVGEHIIIYLNFQPLRRFINPSLSG